MMEQYLKHVGPLWIIYQSIDRIEIYGMSVKNTEKKVENHVCLLIIWHSLEIDF